MRAGFYHALKGWGGVFVPMAGRHMVHMVDSPGSPFEPNGASHVEETSLYILESCSGPTQIDKQPFPMFDHNDAGHCRKAACHLASIPSSLENPPSGTLHPEP